MSCLKFCYLELQNITRSHLSDCGFEPHCRRGVFFWYGPLASFSFKIASVALEHQWTSRAKIASQLLKIHLFLLVKAAEFWRVTCKQMA